MSSHDENELFNAGLLASDPRQSTKILDTSVECEPGDGATGETSRYKPFPLRYLPQPLHSYVKEAAAALGCDPSYVALPALVAVASTIGNTRRILLKKTWTEPSVIWAANIGNSGTLKSPALEIAFAPLERLMGLARMQYAEELGRYELEVASFQRAQRRKSEPQLEAAPPSPPTLTRYFCSDITVETLAGYLVDAPRGLALKCDELSGWLKSFNQYKGGHGADASHFLEMHGARSLHVDRKSNKQSIYVPHAAVSKAGGIQPAILVEALGREHLDNGLAARLLVTMPPPKPKRWNDSDISDETQRLYFNLFDRLLKLEFCDGENGRRVPVDLTLTSEALALWIDFYEEHAIEQSDVSGALSAAFSKLEGYAARFALLTHVVRQVTYDRSLEHPDVIDSRSIATGVELAKWFAYETERVYKLLGISRPDPSMHTAPSNDDLPFALIRRLGGRISVRQLMHRTRRYRESAEDARAVLELMVKNGFGRWVDLPAKPGPGQPPNPIFELVDEPSNGGNGNGIPTEKRGREP